MGREKAGVVPIKIVSCWSDSGEAVGGVFGVFGVGLWDGTGLNNRTGLDNTVSSCGNTGAVRVFVVRANINSSSSGISVLAQYGCCCCTTAAMTIMRRILSGPLLLLLLLWPGMSIPGVLFAIPWLVLLWHALGLVGVLFASAFIECRQNWCVVMCLFSLWWQRSVLGAASFVEWWFDTVLLLFE